MGGMGGMGGIGGMGGGMGGMGGLQGMGGVGGSSTSGRMPCTAEGTSSGDGSTAPAPASADAGPAGGIKTTPPGTGSGFKPVAASVVEGLVMEEGEGLAVLCNMSLMFLPDDSVLRSNPRDLFLRVRRYEMI